MPEIDTPGTQLLAEVKTHPGVKPFADSGRVFISGNEPLPE
jgi:hypothetical protein